MYEAVGRAVLTAQVFEIVFVVCIELVQSMRRVNLGESTDLINPNRFRDPTKKLLKELAERNDIDAAFEGQIGDLVEKRHLLIHRWALKNGLPGDSDADEIARLTALAVEVEHASSHITSLLVGYVNKWLIGEGGNSGVFSERLGRAERLFHDAHKQGSQVEPSRTHGIKFMPPPFDEKLF
jgi:hypothetical protein